MDHVSNLHNMSSWLIPWGTFLAGLAGSAHCVGMCGGLVTASCHSSTENASYQIGRLFSYSFLGLIGGLIGQSFTMQELPQWVGVIPAILIGAIFILMGYKAYNGSKLEFPMPEGIIQIQSKLFGKLFRVKQNIIRPFSIGLISILLPCGFLYGVLFAVAAFQNIFIGIAAMAGFWLGTVPAMAFAPTLFQKTLGRLTSQSPKLTSLTLITVGLATIIIRVVNIYGKANCVNCH